MLSEKSGFIYVDETLCRKFSAKESSDFIHLIDTQRIKGEDFANTKKLN